ncbi:related to ph-regulated antigen pra1 precursor [Ustilago trichophora]|uniref:Related to ph-regulated antigen pra1 n=1 Tax=Ustilago trichophora TaxID=86804 RepID=A0A5C3E1M7_9BASI|nr:related to ph-regulated antigen pra1 precursor [Ustilago trichophora]
MQLTAPLLALTLAASAVTAAPFTSFLEARAAVNAGPEEQIDAVWKIHESCNGTQRAQISRAVSEMKKLAHNSINHILNHPMDEYFVKYFGAKADPAPVLGYYEQLVYGDKGNALLRCDNIDGNCRFPDWNGHWRGNNATSETVICDLSYVTRRPLEQLCAFGYQLGTDNPSQYFGADLMHRAFHVPEFVHEQIHHYADSYPDCLELAKTNSSAAVSNQHSLQYFALDIYSRKTVKWGCVGEVKAPTPKTSSAASAASSTAAAPASTSSSASATAAQVTAAPAASQTQKASADCHTHADGTIHCGTH